jgi:hypothetical protein
MQMGGGLFNMPFYLNEKCLVFSAFVVFVYLLPKTHPIWTSVILAFTAYILLAWYDYLYSCNDLLQPTFLGYLSSPFKPAEYGEKIKRLPIKYQKMLRTVDIVILILTLGALAYTALRK